MLTSCRCFRDGQFEQAVGIALEARRLDKVDQAVQKAPDKVATLTYALRVCQNLVISREFRFEVDYLACCRLQTTAHAGFHQSLLPALLVPTSLVNLLLTEI